MKTAATVFSWLGWIVNLIISIVNLDTVNKYLQMNGLPKISVIFIIITAVIQFSILCWRQAAVANGDNVACGIMTLLFVSLLGGIFTLCIREESYVQTPREVPQYNGRITQNTGNSRVLTRKERDEQIAVITNMYKKGVITKAEYYQRVAKLNARCPDAPYVPNVGQGQQKKEKPVLKEEAESEKREKTATAALSEDEKIATVRKYKQLLDDGIITEEEFTEKKKSILK